MRVIRREEQMTKLWSGGTTTELYIYPESASYEKRDFFFRVSTATVEDDYSKFTELKGITRWITSITRPLILKHQQTFTLEPFEVYQFDGGIETECFSKVTDMNLMTQGIQGSMEVKELNRRTVIDSTNQIVLIYPLSDMICSELNVKEKELIVAEDEEIVLEMVQPAKYIEIRIER